MRCSSCLWKDYVSSFGYHLNRWEILRQPLLNRWNCRYRYRHCLHFTFRCLSFISIYRLVAPLVHFHSLLYFLHVPYFLHMSFFSVVSLLFSNHFPDVCLWFNILILLHWSQDVAWSRDLLISCVIAVLISEGSCRLFAVRYWRTFPVTTISPSRTEWKHHYCFILDSNFWLLRATPYLSSTIIAVPHQNWHFGRF